jgi:hypothetical protein
MRYPRFTAPMDFFQTDRRNHLKKVIHIYSSPFTLQFECLTMCRMIFCDPFCVITATNKKAAEIRMRIICFINQSSLQACDSLKKLRINNA